MKPYITLRWDGEYSTITLPDGVVETIWFPKDFNRPTQVVGRSLNNNQFIANIAREHIAEWESKK